MGLGALVLAGALLLMGQARSGRTVEAERFVLKDASGRVRASLGLIEGNTMLTLYGPQGSKMKGVAAELGVGQNGPFLWLIDGVPRASLGLDAVGPSFTFHDGDGNTQMVLGAGPKGAALAFPASGGKYSASLFGGDAPGLRLEDAAGYSLHLGETDLLTARTGVTQKTSAASVVLFDKDGKTLWSAP